MYKKKNKKIFGKSIAPKKIYIKKLYALRYKNYCKPYNLHFMKIFANYTNKSIKKIYYFDLAPLQGTNKLDLFFCRSVKKNYLSLHVVVKFKIIF